MAELEAWLLAVAISAASLGVVLVLSPLGPRGYGLFQRFTPHIPRVALHMPSIDSDDANLIIGWLTICFATFVSIIVVGVAVGIAVRLYYLIAWG